jgi:hypothetical protein
VSDNGEKRFETDIYIYTRIPRLILSCSITITRSKHIYWLYKATSSCAYRNGAVTGLNWVKSSSWNFQFVRYAINSLHLNGTSKDNHCIRNILTIVSLLSQINPIHAFTFHFYKISFYIIWSSVHIFFIWSHSFRRAWQNLVFIFMIQMLASYSEAIIQTFPNMDPRHRVFDSTVRRLQRGHYAKQNICKLYEIQIQFGLF